MNEAVFVIDPVIVAALGNRNDTVEVIDTLNDCATRGWERARGNADPPIES